MSPRPSRFFLGGSQWMILATIVLLVLLGVGYVERFTQNVSAQAELKQWERKVAEARQRRAFLKEQLDYVQGDDYSDQQAREVLKWVKPGDTPVEVVPVEVRQNAPQDGGRREMGQPFWREWWNLFFGP
ncbi:MAG: septum formation initiator family protein [Anaerolineae bacterium]|nr:septum formation initiator family protein [Anaerolineae bacterium]